MLQSALVQDGGGDRTTSRYTRLLQYDIERNSWEKEFVVPLPVFADVSSCSRTAVALVESLC